MADQRWERDFKGIFFFRMGHLGVEGGDGRVDGVDPWRMLEFQETVRRLFLWEIDLSFVVYTHHFIHPYWVGNDTERSEERPARGALAFYLVK